MRQSVKDAFFDYTAGREGFTPFMYADTLNLVTTGVGNLIDAGARNGFDTSPGAMQQAMSLPWKHKVAGWSPKNPVTDGILASQQEIRDAWITTKLHEQANPGFNKRGGFAYQGLTHLTLDIEGLKTLFSRTLTSFDKALAQRYPGYETWPADAQLALLSMAWAMGPAFNFPAFKEAATRLDFDKAAELSFFKGGGALTDPKSRNAAHVIMFHNAANVLKAGADPDRLFFPGTSVSPGSSGVSPGVIAKMPGIGMPSLATAGKVAGGAAGLGLLGWGLYEFFTSTPKRKARR